MLIKKRNEKIDIVRGTAILMVVLGHTVQYFANGSQTLLSNVIFSLQMPLFMLISGYVCIYSKPIDSVGSFFKRLLRRSYSLLLPWCVWTVLRFFLTFKSYFGSNGFLEYIKYIIMHMDSGYWFLFSLWTIDLIVSLSSLMVLVLKFTGKSKILRNVFKLAFVGIFFVILAIIGMNFGMQTLSIKYTLYYIPFFCLGYLFGEFKEELVGLKCYDIISSISVAVLAVVYLILINTFNVQGMSDSIVNIVIRVTISLSGCATLIYVLSKCKCKGILWRGVEFCGKRSLEIYLVHYCFLKFINIDGVMLTSLNGVLSCILNYGMCLICTFIIIWISDNIVWVRRILFGRK